MNISNSTIVYCFHQHNSRSGLFITLLKSILDDYTGNHIKNQAHTIYPEQPKQTNPNPHTFVFSLYSINQSTILSTLQW